MGLDMYLYKTSDDQREDFEPDPNKDWMGEYQAYCSRHQYAYWRKANAVHKWFVDHVQDGEDDGGEYPVSRQQLISLHECVDTLLRQRAEDEDKALALAERILPPQRGFFFGSTEIDEGYWEDVAYTEKTLREILADENVSGAYYCAEW